MAKRESLLLLVRHGRAEDEHPAGDSSRALTVRGRREFRRLARDLPDSLRIRAIATSPLVRAVQTAEILAEALGAREVAVRRELAQGRNGAQAVAGLARELGTGWALVGHNPTLSEAAALLAGPGGEPLEKGAVLALVPRRKGFAVAWRCLPRRR